MRSYLKLGRSGAAAAEYALVIALVGGAAIFALNALAKGMSGVFTSVASYLVIK